MQEVGGALAEAVYHFLVHLRLLFSLSLRMASTHPAFSSGVLATMTNHLCLAEFLTFHAFSTRIPLVRKSAEAEREEGEEGGGGGG